MKGKFRAPMHKRMRTAKKRLQHTSQKARNELRTNNALIKGEVENFDTGE